MSKEFLFGVFIGLMLGACFMGIVALSLMKP